MPDKILRFEEYANVSFPGVKLMEATQSSVEEHSHDFFELVYVKSGFCLHESEKAATLLVEGDFFLLPPGIRHRYVGPHTIDLTNCIFRLDAVSDYLKAFELFPGIGQLLTGETKTMLPKLHLDIAEQKQVNRILKNMIYEQNSREAGWQIKVKCYLACMLTDFSRYYERRLVPHSESHLYPNYVLKALTVISGEYGNAELSVSAIAKTAGVSADYLSRQFRMLTGIGVQEYLRRYRFAKATGLLQSGMTVSDVSKNVGFSSLCHFSREFKKELGVSPTQYVKINS
ncbi:MAG: helix-turn-helix domain-containing protein [Clostridia bacterium]|nr:helix-turn-helix domain-containing protein [Clostridia bacterium]MBQ4157467.1 helix-turn-helix domain-containing protein [Clostridia bacterium]